MLIGLNGRKQAGKDTRITVAVLAGLRLQRNTWRAHHEAIKRGNA